MADEDLPLEGEETGALDAPVEDVVEETTEDATTQEPAEAQPTSLEDLAAEMGWRPQDDWRGDPTTWKPAAEFVKSTVDVNHKLNNRLRGMEDQITNMARTSAKLTQQAVEQKLQKLLEARQEAFETGDAEKFNKVDKQLTELREPEAPQIVPPEVQDFRQRNGWFEKDQEATAWAVNRSNELGKQGLGPARQLSIIEREAKSLFPELYEAEKPRSKAVTLNQPGSRAGAKPAAKGFNSLPKDAQAAALDYEKRKVCTRDEYAKTYFEELGA